MPPTALRSAPLALIVDFGGVLTAPTVAATRAWCASVGITYRQFVGPLIAEPDGAPSLVHLLETGQLTAEEFERGLGAAITAASGVAVDATGFTTTVVGGAAHDQAMFDLLDEMRERGLRTGLLSNSWGNAYPMDVIDRYFDAYVISGEVGLRKPDAKIYELAAELVGVPPQRCVFVDDLKANIAAAEQVGMLGILHTDAATTRAAVLAALG